MGALSDKEIKGALAKLRQQYVENSETYGKGMFNLVSFEDRYLQAVRSGLPMGTFLAGEVSVFQELKKKALDKTAKLNTGPGKADLMMEEFANRLKKYPLLDLSPKADEESCRLAGMLRVIEKKWGSLIPSAKRLPYGSEASRLAEAIETRIYSLLVPRGAGFPAAVDDFILSIERITAGESEHITAKQYLFKETGFFLHQFEELCGFTDISELQEARSFILQAIEDFRLGEFRLR